MSILNPWRLRLELFGATVASQLHSGDVAAAARITAGLHGQRVRRDVSAQLHSDGAGSGSPIPTEMHAQHAGASASAGGTYRADEESMLAAASATVIQVGGL